MATIRGTIREALTGETRAAKVQVLSSSGHSAAPRDAVRDLFRRGREVYARLTG
jgi:hypothetical protein